MNDCAGAAGSDEVDELGGQAGNVTCTVSPERATSCGIKARQAAGGKLNSLMPWRLARFPAPVTARRCPCQYRRLSRAPPQGHKS
jgi:hypothetical protein